ncbi:MAG: type IV pilin N-terminal domain-containing protein [Lachnospiraceae bacterium]|nr:type IV pilin N-terminal domain-containing protein [Lachnospiraceae bacterium]
MSYILIDSYGALRVTGKPRVSIESSVSENSLPEQEIDVDPFVLEVPAGTYTVRKILSEEVLAFIEEAKKRAEKERRIAYVRELNRRKAAGESIEDLEFKEETETEDPSCPITFSVRENETAVVKMKIDRTGTILAWDYEVRESTERDGFLFFRNQLKEKHSRQDGDDESSDKTPHTIARGNRRKAAVLALGIVIISFIVIAVILLSVLLFFGKDEESTPVRQTPVQESADYDGDYGEDYAGSFIQGKWYALYNEKTFRTIEIEGSRIVYKEVQVEKKRTDDLSPDNIYYGEDIYRINDSTVREGSYDLSVISQLHYNLDTVFASDMDNPEESYQIHVNINPAEQNNIRINIFSEDKATYYTRGDLDELRTYLKK